MKIKIILIAAAIFSLPFGEVLGVVSFAQNVGINTTGNAPNSSALLDVNASPGNNKGVLIPRLPLSATNSGNPISPLPGVGETGLMVYNTATAGVSPNDVVPGFYYWNGSAWAPLGGGGSTGGGWTDDGTVVRLTTSNDFVGIGTASPASTSALDITSTTKGILIPRMTNNQRDAIPTPATGLQIYNIDCQSVNYWTGTCWIAMSKSLPDPGIITSTPASTTFCAGQARTYAIPAIPGATSYIWSVPAGTSITSGNGTTTITATFGNISGNVCVKASNACETSGQTCLAVSVDPIPNTPGNITGITSINPGQTSVTYFVASVNGASTYTWSVPAGATIASGTGTTTIVVNFACTASSGNISVTANSTCGSSPASALALTITPLLAANAGANVFSGVAIGGSPTATGGTTAYTYSWSPTTNLSSSTTANPSALCTGGSSTYTVTVTDSRTCTATSSVVVTRNFTVSAGAAKFGGVGIGGSPTAAGGNPTYTYAWSPTSDLSSSTSANPTALCSGSTTTYTVTATDANGCTANNNVVVTRSLTASAGAGQTVTCSGVAIGGSPTAAGGNPTYTYSWNPSTGLSSATIANPTASASGSTTTYTVTVTDANACAATSPMTLTRSGCTVTLSYTGALQTWTVPAGVTSVKIEAWGAEGGNGYGNNGSYTNNEAGLGGYVYGNKTVAAGNVLNIYVGGKGTNGSSGSSAAGGFNGGGTGGGQASYGGGGGGGGSDVRLGGTALTDRIIVGGAGGGGGSYNNSDGGYGGYSVGQDGFNSGAANGTGGTQAAGGSGSNAGSLGVGGSASGSCGSGGGGGYYGGGAGSGCNSGGAGGGSSYYGGMTSTTGNTNGNRSGNGQVVITY